MSPFRIEPPSRVGAVALAGDDELRSYLDRLLKMIPTEVLGLYLVGSGLIPEEKRAVLVVWTVVCFIGVVVVRVYGTADPAEGKPTQWPAVFIACGAFLVWIYTLGGPFRAYGLHEPYIGSLAVLAWTFFIPRFYKGA